jgi:hypothetical protein
MRVSEKGVAASVQMDGIALIPHYDNSERKFLFERVQDVEDILENNKKLRTQEQHSDWGRHIANIPNIIMELWLNQEYERGNVGLRMFTKEFDELVARKLKDPDWAFLRTDMKSASVGYSKHER